MICKLKRFWTGFRHARVSSTFSERCVGGGARRRARSLSETPGEVRGKIPPGHCVAGGGLRPLKCCHSLPLFFFLARSKQSWNSSNILHRSDFVVGRLFPESKLTKPRQLFNGCMEFESTMRHGPKFHIISVIDCPWKERKVQSKCVESSCIQRKVASSLMHNTCLHWPMKFCVDQKLFWGKSEWSGFSAYKTPNGVNLA